MSPVPSPAWCCHPCEPGLSLLGPGDGGVALEMPWGVPDMGAGLQVGE